jgi:hypothetical protein
LNQYEDKQLTPEGKMATGIDNDMTGHTDSRGSCEQRDQWVIPGSRASGERHHQQKCAYGYHGKESEANGARNGHESIGIRAMNALSSDCIEITPMLALPN